MNNIESDEEASSPVYVAEIIIIFNLEKRRQNSNNIHAREQTETT